MSKISNFLKKIWPSKRKWMQLYFALLFNANARGFVNGTIYTGSTKNVCAPGINCYSCPGAIAACPMGSLQNAMNGEHHGSLYYVCGILVLYGILFGRMICGWLCPFGWIQELLHKIKTPKVKKSPITRVLSYFKYVVLVFFAIIVPAMYAFRDATLPAFCKYICPAGTLEGGMSLLSYKVNEEWGMPALGILFTWKFLLMVSILVGCIFVFRLFCRFLCPLGALYALFNRFSIFGIKLDRDKCVDCNRCIAHCEMDIHHVGDPECISCGECIAVCPTEAIQWKGPKILLPKNVVSKDDTPEVAKAKNKKKLVTRIISTVVLLAVLAGTITYFWIDSKPKTVIALPPDQGNEVGDLCYGYDLPIITTEGIQKETLNPTKLGKVTVINFWYTACGPCVAELPYFDEVAKKYGDEIAVVAVHGMLPETAPAYIAKHYPDSPILFLSDFIPEGENTTEMDRTGYYTMLGGVNNAYPRTTILDENGVVTHVFPNSVTYEELESAVKEALDKE